MQSKIGEVESKMDVQKVNKMGLIKLEQRRMKNLINGDKLASLSSRNMNSGEFGK